LWGFGFSLRRAQSAKRKAQSAKRRQEPVRVHVGGRWHGRDCGARRKYVHVGSFCAIHGAKSAPQSHPCQHLRGWSVAWGCGLHLITFLGQSLLGGGWLAVGDWWIGWIGGWLVG